VSTTGRWVTPATESSDSTPQANRGTSVSVVIPTYKDALLLRQSLPIFLEYPPDDVEIVVVNNDPSQDVRAAVGSQGDDSRVRLVEMGWEAGFARAVNRGIRETSGEFVMFCNADLFPAPTYLAELLAFFKAHPAAGAAIGKLLRYDLETDRPTDVIDSAGLVLSRQRRFMPRGEGERDVGQFDEAVEVFGVDGAATVLRRPALEEISVEDEYLDENFFAHKEDHDISWRLRLAGWECWYVPSAVAYHGRTTRGLGSSGYMSAIRRFHQNELEKSERVQINAMKNQWLMLLKNEDGYNFVRDFPFILAREAMVVTHRLFFAPKSLVAVPMTVRLLPETLRKRRAAKRRQKMDPQALRRWLAGGAAENRPRRRTTLRSSGGDAASPLAREDRRSGLD
jgi:GT2 family glycosyltransferase